MVKGMQDGGTSGPGTTVGVNVALTGTLKDQNDIAIYGMVDGEVISERSVTVGQSAQVKGPVRGALITVAGVVRGSVEAGEKLEILETGKIYGSIDTHDLVVHSGAIIIGKIEMGTEEPEEGLVETEDQDKVDSPSENEVKEETKEESKIELQPDDE